MIGTLCFISNKKELKKRIKEKQKLQYGMNPMDYWYQQNSKVKNKMDGYYSEKVIYINDEEMRNDVVNLYNNGNAMEKTMAISFVGSFVNLFGEDKV